MFGRNNIDRRSPYGLQLPPEIHKVIDEKCIRNKRILIVGDVHGCYNELKDLLKLVRYDNNMCVIFVGDLINKGPKNVDVVRLVREIGAFSVRGNHEELALAAYEKGLSIDKHGKYHWMKKLSEDDRQFLHDLPYTLHILSLNITIVHAGFVPGIKIQNQKLEDMIEIKNIIEDKSSNFKNSQSKHIGTAWANSWSGPSHVYFGHNAKRGLQTCEFATGLDTDCCRGGDLTAALIDTDGSRKFYQIKAKKPYFKKRS